MCACARGEFLHSVFWFWHAIQGEFLLCVSVFARRKKRLIVLLNKKLVMLSLLITKYSVIVVYFIFNFRRRVIAT